MATKKKTTKKSKAAAQKAKTQMIAVLLFSLGALFILLSIVKGSSGWLTLHNILMGSMGLTGYIVGPVLIYCAVMSSFEQLSSSSSKLLLATIWLLLLSAVVTLITPELVVDLGFGDRVRLLYTQGVAQRGGGVISILFTIPLLFLGVEGARIVSVIGLIALTMVLTGTTVYQVVNTAKKPVDKLAETASESISHISAKMESAAANTNHSFKLYRSTDSAPTASTTTATALLPPKKNVKVEQNKERLLKAAGILGEEPTVTETPTPADPIPEEFDPSAIAPTVRAVKSAKKAAEGTEQKVEIDGILQRLATENMAQLKIEEEKPKATSLPEPPTPSEIETPKAEETINTQATASNEVEPPAPPIEYIMPSLELLNPPSPSASVQPVEELKQNAQLLVDTLMSFGVSTRIIDISRGPAVTRYELQPAAGVKISKITNLADDIALNLAAAGVRIEAPIPNKPAVGIEIPNKKVTPVSIREVLDSTEFQSSKSKVTVALGRDIAGNITTANIAKMPHLLIAGSTGSGKSVCINTLIMSILYKAKPNEVKLLMVDPKVVELGIYNGLPHLLVPVVTDPKKAAGALGWAVSEMLTRYKLFAAHSVRDISGFNALCEEQPNLTKMPHIVIIIDELSDLMMASPTEVEDYICRLAQMARAAGMHLVIATQRPSVDVITGIIKANIPSRVAFAVSSQIDSRTILDMGGAEKLLGMGDMLFYPVGAAKPVRVQGCYVSDKEIERVVDFIKQSGNSQYDEQVIEEIEKQAAAAASKTPSSSGEGGGFDSGDDEMIDAAISYIVEAGAASTSMLQRKLKLGYARAARIIDELEARGIVGPFEGSKPRSVLISRERYMEMKFNKDNLGG